MLDPASGLRQAIENYRASVTAQQNSSHPSGRLPSRFTPHPQASPEASAILPHDRARRALDQAVNSARSFLSTLEHLQARLSAPAALPPPPLVPASAAVLPPAADSEPLVPSQNEATGQSVTTDEGAPEPEYDDEEYRTDDDRWTAYRIDLSFAGGLPVPLATRIADALRSSKIAPRAFGSFLDRVESLDLLPMQTRDLIFGAPSRGEDRSLTLSLLERRLTDLTGALADCRAIAESLPNCLLAELFRHNLLPRDGAAQRVGYLQRIEYALNVEPPMDLIDPRYSLLHSPSAFAPDTLEATIQAMTRRMATLPSDLPVLFPHPGDEDAFRNLVVCSNDAGDLRFADPGALWIMLRFGFGAPVQFHAPRSLKDIDRQLAPFAFDDIKARVRRMVSDPASRNLFESNRGTVALLRRAQTNSIGGGARQALDHLSRTPSSL